MDGVWCFYLCFFSFTVKMRPIDLDELFERSFFYACLFSVGLYFQGDSGIFLI